MEDFGLTPQRRRVVRVSLADQVTENVRDMILVGELLPGQKVTHDELAGRLGVSTMPVREAMLRLTHEGFITVEPSRHFEVALTTRDDITDIYWAHAVLAGELTARACVKADAVFIDALASAQERLEIVTSTDAEELGRINNQFHRLINMRAESPKLLMFLRNSLRLIPERWYALVPEWRDLSIVGHREIVESIKNGDAERSKQAAEEHVRDAGAMIAEHFSDRGYWTRPGEA